MKHAHKIKFSIVGRFLKTRLTEERTYFTLTLLTGILAGVVTVSFQYLISNISTYIGTYEKFTPESFLMGGALILLSGWITTRYFNSTTGSGVPRVKIALAVYNGKIPFKETLAKYVTTVLSLSSGIPLGKEGPVVMISAGIGSYLGSFFHLSKKKIQALVAVGSAAGIAAAFNTPISAVVFTLEEVVGDLNAKILGSIIISSVAAAMTGHLLAGEHIISSKLIYQMNNPLELFFYFLIGLAAAFSGPLWMQTTLKLRLLFGQVLKDHRLSIIVLSFCLVGALSLLHPAVLGSGKGFLEKELLSLIFDWKILLLILILKFFATSLTYAAGPSGGLFMPTLLIGATLGSLIGTLGHDFFPDIVSSSTSTYALVGMGAYFVTVIRAPFTSILIVFELTRDYNIILPVMIANVVAYMLSEKITDGSIYEQISEQDGIHLPTREDEEILDSFSVEDALVKDVFTFNHDDTIKNVYFKLKNSDVSGFPILKNGKLFGVVAKNEVLTEMSKKNHNKKIYEVCAQKVIKVYPDQSLLVALHLLDRFHISRLPVVSRLDNKNLVGVITAYDILQTFGHQLKVEKSKIELEDKEYEKQLLKDKEKDKDS